MYESSAYAHSVTSSNLSDKKPVLVHSSSNNDENMSDDEQVNSTSFLYVHNNIDVLIIFQMVIAEPTSSADVPEIDLKCAEKVTDSDVEESNLDSEDTRKAKVPNLKYL